MKLKLILLSAALFCAGALFSTANAEIIVDVPVRVHHDNGDRGDWHDHHRDHRRVWVEGHYSHRHHEWIPGHYERIED